MWGHQCSWVNAAAVTLNFNSRFVLYPWHLAILALGTSHMLRHHSHLHNFQFIFTGRLLFFQPGTQLGTNLEQRKQSLS